MIGDSYRDKTEDELVRASLDGDRLAFGEIVRRNQGMVARTVKGMLGNTVDAEDVGQDVFIKLYRSLRDFRGDSKLPAYIQKIAVNLTLNELKRRKRYLSVFARKDNAEIPRLEIAAYDDEEKRDASEIVSRALMNLNPKYRMVVTMRMLQGYSTKETAEMLDLPVGTVLSRLARAQSQLREILKKL